VRIAIVGGGAAGLTAAYRLAQAGHSVCVYEAQSALGGQAGTFEVAGKRLERFYHHIFHSDDIALRLMAELGLEDRLVWGPDLSGVFHGGRVHPFVTPGDLLRFTPLPLLDRLACGMQTAYLLYCGDWRRLERVTARDWLHKWGPQSAYDVIWGALLRSKFGDYADRVSMAWLWGKLNARRGKSIGGRARALGYPLGSFQILFDELSRRLGDLGAEVHTSTPVTRITSSDGAVRGLRVQEGARTVEREFDAVILTVASPIALQLTPDLPSAYAEQLRSLPYYGAAVLVLALDRSLLPTYWLSLPEPDIPMVVAVEHTRFIPAGEYDGRHIVYLSRYLSPTSPDYARDPDETLALYEPYIRRLNPLYRREWVVGRWLFKDPYAQPIIEPGYSQRIPAHRTPIANLYLANTTQIYPEDRGVNYSVLLGETIATIVQGGEARASRLW
jgi:protoporphyrinogen oxidase